NWNTAANWTNGVPAGTSFSAFIDGGNAIASDVTLDTSPFLKTFTLDADDSLTFNRGSRLVVTGGTVTVNGTMNLGTTLDGVFGASGMEFQGGVPKLAGSGQINLGGAGVGGQ